jgi:hypothetical protein
MPFPKLSSRAALPPDAELRYLSDWETGDKASRWCISFWQYIHVLHELDKAGAFTPRVKKALKVLYLTNSPLGDDELQNRLKEKHGVVARGLHGLGGFGKKILAQLTKDFPPFQFPIPGKATGNVNLQVFLDLVRDKKKDKKFYYCLRSRFRAALAQYFGDTVINSW